MHDFMENKAYRRKKLEMAYTSSVSEHVPINKTITIKKMDLKNSTCLFQDSGYNESLKEFSITSGERSCELLVSKTVTQEYENSENVDPTRVCSPIKYKSCDSVIGIKETKHIAGLFETPRAVKKDFSLRRRLLVSKTTSGGNLDFDSSECSAESHGRQKSLQRISSFEASLLNSFDESPRDANYKPIATSTLKCEPESGTSCKKWRLSFAQQRSSTLDDSKCDGVPFPEVENISPVQHSTVNSANDDSILSFNEESVSEMPGTPTCSLTACVEEFQTPVSTLVANFSFNLCTPIVPLVSDLDTSITEDSAFHSLSLSLDKSQDSITDHEGSFQELIQKQKDTPKAIPNKNRLRKLDRYRRLSTLRERGSQSDVEEEGTETHLLSSAYKLKVARESVDEENELSSDDCRVTSVLNIEDLTGTPALRVVHEMLLRSNRKRPQHATVQDLLGNLDNFERSEDALTSLIGRKMGLEKLDILAELKYRNLKHIISFIFALLNVESICSVCRVSTEWREIVLQDKIAHQRRKSFLKKLKVEAEQGRLLSSEDASTRLNLINRSALKSVQATAAFRTPTSCQAPKSQNSSIPLSASKHQEYVKVAKTLFTDEALKPCPRCQYPAKYQALKKRGRCSRKDCGFDFCILCLCAFHGSKECSSGSAKKIHKNNSLPGSAQSKRNLKRL
ncbi:F-box only protein 43 [Rhinophrynus dorsalis]